MKILIGFYLLVILTCSFFSCNKTTPSNYQGKSFLDAPQVLPGKLQCEYYDLGESGIAYHDADTFNNGSGNLNRGSDSLSVFRANESVDISFTKYKNGIDNSIYNLVQPKDGQLYVGWTEPGEWLKYTVDVQNTGKYKVGIMYTAHDEGQISLSVNDEDVSGVLTIPSTFDDADTIDWRQWHHWNYLDNLGSIHLDKGIRVITLHTVAKGQMNYDFIEFTLID